MHYIVTYTLHNENIVILGNYILLIDITPKPLPSSVIVIFYNYIQDFAKNTQQRIFLLYILMLVFQKT